MANKFLTLTSTNGVPTATQPAFTDLSGSASLTTQVSGILPIANGGTDNGSLAVTAGGILYTDGTKFQNAGAGSSGQVLTSNGASAPTWQTAGSSSFRAGSSTLSSGVTSKAITFSTAFGSTSYAVSAQLLNTTDAHPQFQPITITAQSTTGFTATWDQALDTGNYSLTWMAMVNN